MHDLDNISVSYIAAVKESGCVADGRILHRRTIGKNPSCSDETASHEARYGTRDNREHDIGQPISSRTTQPVRQGLTLTGRPF